MRRRTASARAIGFVRRLDRLLAGSMAIARNGDGQDQSGKSALICPCGRPSGGWQETAEFLAARTCEPGAPDLFARGRQWLDHQFDAFTGETVVSRIGDEGVRKVEDLGLEIDIDRRHDYRIKADDPLSASAYFTWKRKYRAMIGESGAKPASKCRQRPRISHLRRHLMPMRAKRRSIQALEYEDPA